MHLTIPPGLRYMAYGAFWFSAMGMFVKLAGVRLPSTQIILVRAVITLVLSWLLIRHERLNPWPPRRKLLLLRGLLGAVALTCFYYSLVHLPLAEATVIQYLHPLLVSLLAAALLRERPRPAEWGAVLVSLCGVLLIARPGVLFGGGGDIRGLYVGVAVVGAVFSSLAYLTVRHLRHEHHPLVVVFYFPLVTVPLILPFALRSWVWPTAAEWVVLLGVGITTQIAQVYMTRGLQLEEAVRATTVGYVQIVFAAVWGVLVFREFPDVWSFVGAAVIAVSTLAVLAARARGDADEAGS